MSDPVRTYEGDFAEQPSVPCWLCGASIAVKKTKTGQPYMSCIDCGMQMFVRSTAGAERLRALCAGGHRDMEPSGGAER